jgi:hypothetical protein
VDNIVKTVSAVVQKVFLEMAGWKQKK